MRLPAFVAEKLECHSDFLMDMMTLTYVIYNPTNDHLWNIQCTHPSQELWKRKYKKHNVTNYITLNEVILKSMFARNINMIAVSLPTFIVENVDCCFDFLIYISSVLSNTPLTINSDTSSMYGFQVRIKKKRKNKNKKQ